MAHTLRALVPQGGGLAVRASGEASEEPLAPAVLTYTDAGGSGRLSASVGRVPAPVAAQLSQCPDPSEHPYSRCTVTKLDNGATLLLDQSPVDETKPSAGQRWTAVRIDRDGGQVAVSASRDGGSGGGDGGDSSARPRPAPALDGRQLTDIAVSARWNPVLAAVPAPPRGASPAPSFQYLPAAKITEVIRRATPQGLRTADEGGAPGYGHLTVDDGRGSCLIAVTVQRWKPGDKALEEVFAGAAGQADGTRVKTTRDHPRKGGEGAVAWSVDTWRSDGLRVAVTELNTHAYRLPGKRHDPALGVDRLKRLALSDAWRTAIAEEDSVRRQR
ncbi:hypothetical protein ABZ990_00080 [Streptomyces sp. NPDC046203]|uniref:hypothetical protein n=1 Tax=Streptomyces sp. NPDC046203 TaxID=3154602 RepID=UPI00340DEB29